jgi:hypothetical protein
VPPQSLFCDYNEAQPPAPLPPRSARSPSPAAAGEDASERPRPRSASRFEFRAGPAAIARLKLRSPPLTACFSLPSHKKEGRRNADRRVVNGCIVRMRRAPRSAMLPSQALRARSPVGVPPRTHGSDRTPPLNSSYALPGTEASSGVTCIWPRPSPAGPTPQYRSSCRTGVSAGAARERRANSARGHRARSALRHASGRRPLRERDVCLLLNKRGASRARINNDLASS